MFNFGEYIESGTHGVEFLTRALQSILQMLKKMNSSSLWGSKGLSGFGCLLKNIHNRFYNTIRCESTFGHALQIFTAPSQVNAVLHFLFSLLPPLVALKMQILHFFTQKKMANVSNNGLNCGVNSCSE